MLYVHLNNATLQNIPYKLINPYGGGWGSTCRMSIIRNGNVALSIFFFFNCMFYQVLGVPHGRSSTPTWGSVLPSIETRDQDSRGCPLLFSNRNLGSFCA